MATTGTTLNGINWQEGTRTTGRISGFIQAGRPDESRSGPFIRDKYTAIRAKARLSRPKATAGRLQALGWNVQKSSPVRDCLASPVPADTALEIL